MAATVLHTANDVSVELLRLGGALENVVDALCAADDDAVKAKLAYDLRFSKAYIVADGSIELRKHAALVETHEWRLRAELADVTVRNLRRKVESLRIQVDTTRSIGAAIRAETQAFPGTNIRG